jgi:hypothetical protein
MSGHSLRAAIDRKCRDCGACDAGANWREHVSCCPVSDCALWPVRPISKAAPGWLASRDVKALPQGWQALPLEAALTLLRKGHSSSLQDSVWPSCSHRTGKGGRMSPIAPKALAGGSVAVPKGGAPC